MKKLFLIILLGLISLFGFGQTPSTNCSVMAAQRITVNATCIPSASNNINTALGAPTLTTCTATGRDGWFWFQATSNSTIINFTNTAGDAVIFVYSGACGSLVQIGCVDALITGTETITVATTIGSNYAVRIVSYGVTNVVGTICAYNAPPPPINDACANATNLPCGTVNMAGTTVNSVAETSPGSCASSYGVWYTFTGNGCSNTISSTAGTGFDHEIDIFYGSCASMTSVACVDVALSAGIETYTFIPTNGVQYYVYVAYYSTTGTSANTGTFTISRSCSVPCIGTPIAGISSCTPNSVTCGNSAVILNATGISTDCGVSYQWQYNTGSGWNNLAAATTVPYTTYPSVNTTYQLITTCTNSGLSNISSTSSATILNSAPINDEPCNAITLPINFGFCANQTYSTSCASASEILHPVISSPGCANYLGGDIWFKVTVPASGRIIIDTDVGGITDGGMAMYTSTTNDCNNINTLVECDDDDSNNGAMTMIAHTGTLCTVPCCAQQNATLTPGQTVYIRFWEYGNDVMGTFNICAYEPTPPQPAITCANATVISSLPYAGNSLTTCCAGNDYTSANACLSSYMNGEDYLFKYTPTINQTIDITVSGASIATGLFITNGCPDVGTCVASSTASASPSLCGINLTAGVTYYIIVDTYPTPNCTNFNIVVTPSSAPSCGLAYTQSSPGWSWDDISVVGTNVGISADDVFASAYSALGFSFCYDGIIYNRCLISSNGYIIFDPIGCSTNLPTSNAAPNGYSPWDITMNAPNTTNMPRNSIMFPWADIDPSTGVTPDIKYTTLGVAPNRRFVVSYVNVPMFGSSCTAYTFTGQVVLYETTNNIDIRIQNYQSCSGWNEGGAIVGLSNYNGTNALIAPSHNYTPVWNATNYTRRFTFGCLTCTAPLSIELNQFKVTCDGEFKHIEWSTLSETNTLNFEVQRSINAVDFETFEIINAAGNSNSIINYEVIDYSSYFGTVYYRLVENDLDGYKKVFQVESVNCNVIGVYLIPNPSNRGNEVKIVGEYSSIVISDMIGRDVKAKVENNEIKDLLPGMYIVVVDNKYKFKLIVK